MLSVKESQGTPGKLPHAFLRSVVQAAEPGMASTLHPGQRTPLDCDQNHLSNARLIQNQ